MRRNSRVSLAGVVITVSGIFVYTAELTASPVPGTWSTGPDMPQGLGETRGAVLDGKFYVVGGRTGHGSSFACVDSMQVYDPGTDAWSYAAPLPNGRAAVGLAAMDGSLFCFGGLTEAYWWGWASNSAYRYDPVTDAWSTLASMPTARSNFVTAVIDEKIYCAGGNAHWPNATSRVDVYDPSTNQWSTVASMPESRGAAKGGTFRGDLVYTDGLRDAFTPRRNGLSYDAGSDVWSSLPSVQPGSLLGGEGGFLFSDDDGMYFLGGREGFVNETWLCKFDPLSGTTDWISKAPLAREFGAAGYDPMTGTVYAAGGSDGTGASLVAFEYCRIPEPATIGLLLIGGLGPAFRRLR
ncbi:MAG: PEP-CTERM sorting domain-containing protein [Phycisphaerae bacterium]|nr:PEP-CTERM sorting domain-containing protein [Phycisphaerae bacterium]